ncbi:cytochrome b562 [Acinetobacter sp. ANC 4805]|uniref:cytochrome b562 n=1 Tax=Acinetobacter sp. ANC 4805 TaxID=2923425 RepID=UPI001F4AB871|nr:cytochrome b562 [Acinetobacter sp. ANC 4805]MCH7312691.1 cytochrome b562 [Acinetobacter sp. ANC 4805]
MKKLIISLLISAAAILSQNTIAADLDTDMWALAKNYKAFNKAENISDALKSLDAMKFAANDAKQSVPNKLKSLAKDDVQVVGYQAGLDALIAEIDKTATLVQANQLDQAKIEAKNLLTIRDENHKKFK